MHFFTFRFAFLESHPFKAFLVSKINIVFFGQFPLAAGPGLFCLPFAFFGRILVWSKVSNLKSFSKIYLRNDSFQTFDNKKKIKKIQSSSPFSRV